MTDRAIALSIGQVAERTGLSVHALRFYEREGVLAGTVRRDHGGRRVYCEDDVEWLAMCARFRETGMPLPEIRRYAELVRQGPGNEKERLSVLREHQERVTDQIRALGECLDVIAYKVRIYEDHLDDGTAARLWSGTQT